MQTYECIGLVVCVIASASLYFNSQLVPVVIPFIAFYVFINITNRYVRAPLRAAQKAVAKNASKKRPQTKNTRAKLTDGKKDDKSSKGRSKRPQTVNPRAQAKDSSAPQIAEPKPVSTEIEKGTTDHETFSLKARERRRDEHVFRRQYSGDDVHPSEKRKRILDVMYQELVETTVKTDPFLRKSEDSCQPLRGSTKPHVI